jgi:hypothetical protein
MEFYRKLPRNKKEFALFLAIVSILSVNIIAPLITCFELGFYWFVWMNVLCVLPFIWLAVVVFALLTHKPAAWMTSRILEESDSFNAHIIVNTLCNVLLMSIALTVVGAWIGTRQITMEPIYRFFYHWPRNFTIAFGVEILIAQPFARCILLKLHQHQDKKQGVPDPS